MGLRVRVGTYNLYAGADLALVLGEMDQAALAANTREVRRQLEATAFPDRVEAVATQLLRHRPDLVGLQELCRWSVGKQVLWDYQSELLAALEHLGDPYELVVSQRTFSGSGALEDAGQSIRFDVVGDNAILRRLGSPVGIDGTSAGLFGNVYRVETTGATVASVDRGWCAARCAASPGGPGFAFVDTHTEAYDQRSRDVQRDELLAILDGGTGTAVLVGDFNATPDQVGMPAGFIDAWVAAGHPSQGAQAWTCCQAPDLHNDDSRLHERIDYVWVREAAVVSAQRIGAEATDRTPSACWPSDHAGVVAEIELP